MLGSPVAGVGGPSRTGRIVLLALSLVYLLVQIPLLDTLPMIAVDESWYANTAHNLARGQGLINTAVGERGGDQFFLYPLLVSAAFKLFGTTLWVGRFVSVLFGLIALWGWAFICQRLSIRGSPMAATGLLFITSNVYFILFRRLRPEALVLTLSVWALYFFIDAWQGRRPAAASASALLAAGSMLAHPNGLILAIVLGVAIGAMALVDRSPRLLFGYTAGGIVAVVVFLLGWHISREQALLDFVRESLFESHRVSVAGGSVLSTVWTNVGTFVPEYSLGLKRFYILLFELGILSVGLALYRREPITAAISAIGLGWFLLSLAIWTPFFRWAFSVLIIFSLVVTARVLSLGPTRMSQRLYATLCVLTALYGVNTLAGDAHFFEHNAANTPYSRVVDNLDARIPAGAPVITHLELWFAFQRNPVYTPFTRWTMTPYSGLRQLLESGEPRYAALSSAFIEGRSPLTGQAETQFARDAEHSDRFYRTARAYLVSHGQRVAVVPTRGYGEIEIWEIPPTIEGKISAVVRRPGGP